MHVWNPTSEYRPLPLKTDDELIWQLCLLRSSRVGPATYKRLISEHGSAQAAVEALPELAASRGVKRYIPYSFDRAAHEFRMGRQAGAQLIDATDVRYPDRLASISDGSGSL